MQRLATEHTVTAMPEKRGETTRYRGRCSCGAQSHLQYSRAAMAKAALRRTHLMAIQDGKDST